MRSREANIVKGPARPGILLQRRLLVPRHGPLRVRRARASHSSSSTYRFLAGFPPFSGASPEETWNNLKNWQRCLRRPQYEREEDKIFNLSDCGWSTITACVALASSAPHLTFAQPPRRQEAPRVEPGPAQDPAVLCQDRVGHASGPAGALHPNLGLGCRVRLSL
jgi:hypothetical protein